MSDHYKALTRKYRPFSFEDIVSQEHVSSTLKNAIETNRLNHAYLFCGPRGVGKTTMARVLARTLNEVGEDIDGEALNQTLNIIEVDAASNNKVEDAHRIREAVRVPPQSGRYKIFIIDEVHMLSKQAFNALLKTLEEPPAYAIFIFATTEPHKVIPTILSRVQRFDFKPISVPEIVERLRSICDEESIAIDDESLHMIARKAEGALRDALGLLDQVVALCGTDIRYEALMKAFNAVSLDRLFELTGYIQESDSRSGIQLVSDLLQEGHDIQEFLIALTEHLRNLLMARDKRNMYAIETSKDVKARLHETAQHFTDEDLMRMLHIVHEAQFRIRDAHQPRILLEMTVLKLIRMTRSEGLTQLMKEVEELKKALQGTGGGVSAPAAKGSDRDADAGAKTSVAAATPASPEKKNPENRADYKRPTVKPIEQGEGEAAASVLSAAGHQPSVTRKPGLRRKAAASDQHTSAPHPGGNGSTRVEDQGNAHPADGFSAENGTVTDKASGRAKAVYLHDVTSVWDKYVEGLKEPVPMRVKMCMDSVQPVDLKGKELVLQSHDHLIAQLIEENHQLLSSSLEPYVGSKLRMRCKVSDLGAAQPQAEDPYTKFRRLQEKDPRIKTIVDVFGAELEW